jgi:hypothetical protein
MTDEAERKARAFAWFKQRIADLTGTTLDANGDLDEDALTEEAVHGAMAVIEAEIAVYGAPERAAMEALADEELVEQVTEAFFAMSEDQRNTIRRLMAGHMDEDERNELIVEAFSDMDEDERNELLSNMSEDERNEVRRLMHLDDEDEE